MTGNNKASGDFLFQMEFVVENAWRLLAMQDSNTLSPSYGCFHYSYWRDKTSEFPDARFQEAGATLGLLAHSEFDSYRKERTLISTEILYDAFSAGLRNLAYQQYPDGSYDEWYKGERGFAATAFTTCAYCLSARHIGYLITESDRKLLIEIVGKAANWLTKRDDLVKMNHEAVAAAALALAWEITCEEEFKVAAQKKIGEVISNQNEEGWFPEVGGMDLGYCSVLLDYIMLYYVVTEDQSPLNSMRKLVHFMLPHLHPDLTISPEAGLCLNPYVSRLGMGLLSPHDDMAAAITGSYASTTVGHDGLLPYLADDLRFARWSYLPIAAFLMREKFSGKTVGTLSDIYPSGITFRKKANLFAYHDVDLHLYFSPAGGGMVRCYHKENLLFEDLGFFILEGNKKLGTGGYDSGRFVREVPNGYTVSLELGEAKFFFPSFILRLILRLGSITPISSRIIRAAIDWYRLRSSSAINQSIAPVIDSKKRISFERTVKITEKEIILFDDLKSKVSMFSSEKIQHRLRVKDLSINSSDYTFTDKRRVKVKKILNRKNPCRILKIEVSTN